MVKKHHAKQKKHTSPDQQARLELVDKARQAGFLSINFKHFMNRKDKTVIVLIVLGILVLLLLSIALIFNKGIQERDATSLISPTPAKVITTPYPTIPKEIKDTTILVNTRAISPLSITIIVGGSVGFFNETSEPVEIRGYDNASKILNIGTIAPLDVPVVVFEKAGTYKYINPQNPEEIAEIVVE